MALWLDLLCWPRSFPEAAAEAAEAAEARRVWRRRTRWGAITEEEEEEEEGEQEGTSLIKAVT